MPILIYLVILIALGVFAMLAMQVAGISFGGKSKSSLSGPSKRLSHDSPAAAVAQTMTALDEARDEARAQLRTHYPTLARMLGGYLHAEAIFGERGLEGSVREMILDWQPERKAVIDDIARVLAENSEEADVRAILKSFCDLDLETEGYRAWLIWLQGQYNDL